MHERKTPLAAPGGRTRTAESWQHAWLGLPAKAGEPGDSTGTKPPETAPAIRGRGAGDTLMAWADALRGQRLGHFRCPVTTNGRKSALRRRHFLLNNTLYKGD